MLDSICFNVIHLGLFLSFPHTLFKWAHIHRIDFFDWILIFGEKTLRLNQNRRLNLRFAFVLLILISLPLLDTHHLSKNEHIHEMRLSDSTCLIILFCFRNVCGQLQSNVLTSDSMILYKLLQERENKQIASVSLYKNNHGLRETNRKVKNK